jgi:hypothetical protein
LPLHTGYVCRRLTAPRLNPYEEATLQEIADAHHKTIAQVILRWNVQRGVTVSEREIPDGKVLFNTLLAGGFWNYRDATLHVPAQDREMAQISALDLGYVGEAVKHFNPQFVRGCLGVKIHD